MSTSAGRKATTNNIIKHEVDKKACDRERVRRRDPKQPAAHEIKSLQIRRIDKLAYSLGIEYCMDRVTREQRERIEKKLAVLKNVRDILRV